MAKQEEALLGASFGDLYGNRSEDGADSRSKIGLP